MVFARVQGQGHPAKMTWNWFKAHSHCALHIPKALILVYFYMPSLQNKPLFSIIFSMARIHIERPPRYFGRALLERQTPNFSCVLRASAARRLVWLDPGRFSFD